MYILVVVALFRMVAEMIVIVIPEGATITITILEVAGVTITVEYQW